MSRSIILSNGKLAIGLDERGILRDFYYPHVGLENHARQHYIHRVGVFVDDRLNWLSDGDWQVSVLSEDEALVSDITARHLGLGVELHFSDTVVHDRDVFLRSVRVKNLRDHPREIKLYFSHEFEIHKMHGSDTAYFDPLEHAMIHYKGRRVFLINGLLDGEQFDDFAAGRAHGLGREGSHRDAEDGWLSKNAIEHGPADSIIGFYAQYEAGQERTCEYWIVAAETIPEARKLNALVRHQTPRKLLETTRESWKDWMRGRERDFRDLSPEHIVLFKRSLMYARAHVDHGGGIIASIDSDMFQYGLDTYSYVWMRDASFILLTFDAVGDTSIAAKYFDFCADVITDEGYFMHKYLPDRSLGSSWHPWVVGGRAQLPIQEDETAIVIYALNEHLNQSDDIKLLERVYEPLVARAADFLIEFRDEETKLPEQSYDLWERKRGASTYTSASVYGGLMAAASLARRMRKETDAARYEYAANEVRDAIFTHLWREESGLFYNMLSDGTGPFYNMATEGKDETIDISSVYGIFLFGVLKPDDEKLRSAFEKSAKVLSAGAVAGGIARFENDDYYRVPGPSTGNPWFLTTLWHAEYLTAIATTPAQLQPVKEVFSWAARYALPSGVLSEQINPQTGAQICTGPLAWSHSMYVRAVVKYLEKLGGFEKK